MTRKSAQLDDRLHDYLVRHGTGLDRIQRDLIEETERLFPDDTQMQISPEQASLLTLLAHLTGVDYAVEVGTFTGFSSLAIARGLRPGGRLVCCDTSREYTAVAQRFWQRAELADHIDLRIAPALDTLRALPGRPAIDFSFIDANKVEYVDYWEEIVARTRPGGLITVDNVFAGGGVVDERPAPNAAAIHEFNEHARRDERVELVMVPISDGLTIARKRLMPSGFTRP